MKHTEQLSGHSIDQVQKEHKYQVADKVFGVDHQWEKMHKELLH